MVQRHSSFTISFFFMELVKFKSITLHSMKKINNIDMEASSTKKFHIHTHIHMFCPQRRGPNWLRN